MKISIAACVVGVGMALAACNSTVPASDPTLVGGGGGGVYYASPAPTPLPTNLPTVQPTAIPTIGSVETGPTAIPTVGTVPF